jgi:hypothetical protein
MGIVLRVSEAKHSFRVHSLFNFAHSLAIFRDSPKFWQNSSCTGWAVYYFMASISAATMVKANISFSLTKIITDKHLLLVEHVFGTPNVKVLVLKDTKAA